VRRLALIGAAIALGAGSPVSRGWAQQPEQVARKQVGNAAPDVVLVDQGGRRFALKDLRGRAILVAFIYTSCHHACPLIFDSVSAVKGRIRAEDRQHVAAVFVTVDAEIDTPEVLRAYAQRRGADLANTVFLTGSSEELRHAWEAFGVKVRRLGRGLVDHSPLTFLVDARGIVRYRYYGELLDTEAVVADLRNVLQSTARQRNTDR